MVRKPIREKPAGPDAAAARTARERIVAAFMGLLAEKPFEEIGLGEIATRAELPLRELRNNFSSSFGILAAKVKEIDCAVLDSGDEDIADSRQGRALERFRIFLHASGLSRAERRRAAEAVVANHDWTYAIVTEAAAAGHRGFADHWRIVAEEATRARRWCVRHRSDLLAAAR